MKPVLTAYAAVTATPLFAHTGVHMHPHADDPSWLPVLTSALLIAGAATLAWARIK